MSNLGMFGPTPPVVRQRGDSNLLETLHPTGGFIPKEKAHGRKKILEEEEENVFYHMIAFVLCQE